MDYSQLPPWLASAMGIGGGAAQAAGGAYSLYHPQPNPADAANKTLGQIPGQTEPYYSPYINAGKGAMDTLTNQNKDLLAGDTQNKLGANYKEAPGYQFKLKQMMQQQGNAAGRGGYLGTPMDQQDSMDIANGLASQDYDKYIQNQMSLYNTGYGGTQDINHQGYDASKGMADTIGNTTSQQAAYNFMGQQGQNQAHSSALNNIFTGLGTAGASFFGGPAGGAAFNALMSYLNGQGKGV
jgi:hypothetical protein